MAGPAGAGHRLRCARLAMASCVRRRERRQPTLSALTGAGARMAHGHALKDTVIYMRVCAHVCIYIYECMHTYLFTHTHKHTPCAPYPVQSVHTGVSTSGLSPPQSQGLLPSTPWYRGCHQPPAAMPPVANATRG